MKKGIFIILLICVISTSVSTAQGIKFFKGSFEEAVAKAKKEKKKIFIDFYTEWCGPCLTMAKTVFLMDDVGEVYNKNFINCKIDAEKGEGIELAKKYKVNSYPTYIFVDPKSGNMIHRSGGNKQKEYFIADAEGALNPKLSSFYLEDVYKKGKYNKEFLISYIKERRASAGKDVAIKMFDELINKFNAKLTEREIWDLYISCFSGWDNVYFKEVVANYDKFVALYGKKEVDANLKSATAYAPAKIFATLPDFEGKDLNLALIEFNATLRVKNYDEAIAKMDKILSNDNFDKQAVMNTLSFAARINPKYNEDEIPYNWILKKVEYLRYVAYNNDNRDDARPHYDYATGLEYLIKRSAMEQKQIPLYLFEAPKYGKKEYDMRPAELKQKPSRKK